MRHIKPSLTYTEQIKLLQARGLIIENPIEAEQFLAKVNYYRLSGYCLPFEQHRHLFKPKTTFEDISSLYKFDQSLRHLIDNALEIIEIYLRAKITYTLSLKQGPFIHEDPCNFHDKTQHSQWLNRVHEEIERSKETFVIHYRGKYEGFPKLPLWMAVEVMSFGALSKVFSNLKRELQENIANELGFHHSLLMSWVHSMNFIRNVCAHHARLWNREIAISMKLPKTTEWEKVSSKRIGSVLYVINEILLSIPSAKQFRRDWKSELNQLIENTPHKDFILQGMGFSIIHPLWDKT